MFYRIFIGFWFLICILTVPVAANAGVHTVKTGESLFTISHNYGISLGALMEANGFRGSLIYPGQQLYIPANNTGHDAVYTVRNGDSLYFIGQRFGIDYRKIMSANGLNQTLIYPGAVLYIPSSGSGAEAERLSGYQTSRGYFVRPALADVDLLARLITAEADAEPYSGKVAVGAVVLNRIASSVFPDSIPEVIYQYGNGTYQFEPVMNGWINRPATPESIRAAKDALSGWDPTGGALYFFATYVKNTWLWSRPLSGIIGDVAFTY